MASYLVTGGYGFIGSHLVDALIARGDRVRVLDDMSTGRRENLPDGVDLVIGDAADLGLVQSAMAGSDGCFHLAAVASVARSNDDWLGTHHANQTASIAVFEAARHGRGGEPVPVVFASSAAVYGGNREVPFKETATPQPLSAYGADKLGSELHAAVAAHVHGVPTTGLRFFNVYGPRQDPASPYSGVVSIFAKRIAQGEPVTILGDGEQVRDFIFVADVVRYLLAAMAASPRGAAVYNVCTGRATSVNQLAASLAALARAPLRANYGPPRPGDPRTSVGDPAKAVATFGIAAETDIATGLARTRRYLMGATAD